VRQLLCHVDIEAMLEVRIADGGRLKSDGCCPGVTVKLQNLILS